MCPGLRLLLGLAIAASGAACGLSDNGTGGAGSDAAVPDTGGITPAIDATVDAPRDGMVVPGDGPTEGPPSDATADAPAGEAGPLAGFSKKRQLTIHNEMHGLHANFPVLIVLKMNRIDYTVMRGMGQDLRFTDASFNPLPYEIEKWDPTGSSYVWLGVSVPDHAALVVWMFYGNPAATDAQSPAQVWTDFIGVWHLAGKATDSTGGNPSVNHGGTTTPGAIGDGLAFDGQTQYVDTMSSAELANWTIEAWSNAAAPSNTNTNDGPLMRSQNYEITWDDMQTPRCIDAEFNTSWPCASLGMPNAQHWHDLMGTFDGTNLTAYVDGMQTATQSSGGGAPDSCGCTAKIGKHATGGWFFQGSVDEVRVSSVPHTADWVAAQHASMTDAGYVSYGPEMPNP